eukprot:tig00021352_g20726.t1
MFTALAGSLEARLPCSEVGRFVQAFEPGLGPAEAERLVRQAAGEILTPSLPRARWIQGAPLRLRLRPAEPASAPPA